ncbi:MAG: glycine cleavage system protein H [Treponema sp.]|nr:glycine cleavage system protein H [Treponema sp.]
MKILGYEFPNDRLYDREHAWFKKEGDGLIVGVTDFFQKSANEIVFAELPVNGRNLEIGKPFASIESGKWVGRVKSSINGTVVKSNGELKDFPYLLNESPYDEGWMIEVKPPDQTFETALLDLNNAGQLKEYEDFLNAEISRIAGMAK